MLHTSPLPRVAGLPAFGRVIPRLELDGWIVDAARATGVNIREGWRASAIELDRDGVTVTAIEGSSSERIRARLLMGADGSNSRVAERLRGRPVDKQRRMIAVRAYYDGVRRALGLCLWLFFLLFTPGDFWIFPTGEGRANVGIGTVLRTAPPSTDHLRDLLLGLGAVTARWPTDWARRGSRAKSWAGRSAPSRTSPPDRRRSHDSRRYARPDRSTPGNGEGIQYALVSGRWAAHVASQALREGDCSAASLSPYARMVSDNLRYDMALAQMIVELIRNRSLKVVWLRSLEVLCRPCPRRSRICAHRGRGPGRAATGQRSGLTPHPARQSV